MKMSNSSSVTFSCSRSSRISMPYSFIRVLVILMVILISFFPQNSDGQLEEWCIADEQFSEEELQMAMEWACGNGADCGEVQLPNKPCFFPNTTKDHASFAFNSYYQRMKNKGGNCYFHAAALVTALDPSHGSCKFEYLP